MGVGIGGLIVWKLPVSMVASTRCCFNDFFIALNSTRSILSDTFVLVYQIANILCDYKHTSSQHIALKWLWKIDSNPLWSIQNPAKKSKWVQCHDCKKKGHSLTYPPIQLLIAGKSNAPSNDNPILLVPLPLIISSSRLRSLSEMSFDDDSLCGRLDVFGVADDDSIDASCSDKFFVK